MIRSPPHRLPETLGCNFLGNDGMGCLDFFRGSSDARIARQFIKALREAGESRRLEYEAQSRLVVAYDENGNRAQSSFIGNLAREIRSASAEARDAVYLRYALSAGRSGRAYSQCCRVDEGCGHDITRCRHRLFL